MDDFEKRLNYLRGWWERHGSTMWDSADDWINSLTNVELIEHLSWAKDDD